MTAGHDPHHRPRHPHYEHRVLIGAALSALPFLILALALAFGFRPTPGTLVAWLGVAGFFWWLALTRLRRGAAYPLRTVATLLEALREGDYLLRGRLDAPGDALGEVVREVNLLRDTLHRQRLQVEETLALLGKVIETVDLAVFTFGADRRLGLVNAAGRALVGIERIDQDPPPSAAELGLEPFLSATEPLVVEWDFAAASGRWDVRHRTFREGGKVHHLLLVSDLSRALREQERSAWQRLIRVLGHEINNSLAPIQSITEALGTRLAGLELDGELAEDLRDGLDLIATRSAALERFVKGYTLLARLPEPRVELVEIGALIRRVARFESDRAIVCEGPELIVAVDPGQLEQVLINLLKNAIEASPAGGEVRVRWRLERNWVLVDVEDQGPGLPESGNLFVPFFTTKPDGNGIGLVLGRRIAEAHGGRLDLSNRADGGCRARLRLPSG